MAYYFTSDITRESSMKSKRKPLETNKLSKKTQRRKKWNRDPLVSSGFVGYAEKVNIKRGLFAVSFRWLDLALVVLVCGLEKKDLCKNRAIFLYKKCWLKTLFVHSSNLMNRFKLVDLCSHGQLHNKRNKRRHLYCDSMCSLHIEDNQTRDGLTMRWI